MSPEREALRLLADRASDACTHDSQHAEVEQAAQVILAALWPAEPSTQPVTPPTPQEAAVGQPSPILVYVDMHDDGRPYARVGTQDQLDDANARWVAYWHSQREQDEPCPHESWEATGIDRACQQDDCEVRHDCDGYHPDSPHYGHCCHSGHLKPRTPEVSAMLAQCTDTIGKGEDWKRCVLPLGHGVGHTDGVETVWHPGTKNAPSDNYLALARRLLDSEEIVTVLAHRLRDEGL